MNLIRAPLGDLTNRQSFPLPCKSHGHALAAPGKRPHPSSPLCSPLPSSSIASSSPVRTTKNSSLRWSSSVPPSSPGSFGLDLDLDDDANDDAITPIGPRASEEPAEVVELVGKVSRVRIQPRDVVHIGRKPQKLHDSEKPAGNTHPRYLRLPKAAKHASRVHCTARLEPTESGKMELLVHVRGQNGMQVDGDKVEMGVQRIDIEEDKREVKLGFYSGFVVFLVCGREEEGQGQHLSGPREHAHSRDSAIELAVLTSEGTIPFDLSSEADDLPEDQDEVEHNEDEEEEERETSEPPKKRQRVLLKNVSSFRQSSAAPSPYAHQEDDGYPPSESSDEEELDPAAHDAEVAARLGAAQERVKGAIAALSLDLVGCLASSLVFQPRATLTTTECVVLLLESQPALLSYGESDAWRPFVARALQHGPFGCIANTAGLKDAAGRLVETAWHYSPQLDEDKGRRSSLQPFVKTVRNAARQRAQYYFKPISDLKKRRW